ncbi:MAG: hypothetical protein J6V21_09145 [Alistipes sp.]|nr:hypothetical protein [Alistipes sp.]
MCTWGLEEWGDIANIVIAVASVATAIVTTIVLCKQFCLQCKQNEDNRLEHQPIFEFEQNDDAFIIYAKGASMAAPAKIEITSVIAMEPAKATMENGRYYRYGVTIPYKNYRSIDRTYNLSGKLIECRYADTDMLFKLTNLVKGLERQIKHPLYFGIVAEDLPVYASDLIKIEYMDMYKAKRTIYYFNLQEIPKWLYEEMQKELQDHPFGPYDISELSVDGIIKEVLKFRHRLPYNA